MCLGEVGLLTAICRCRVCSYCDCSRRSSGGAWGTKPCRVRRRGHSLKVNNNKVVHKFISFDQHRPPLQNVNDTEAVLSFLSWSCGKILTEQLKGRKNLFALPLSGNAALHDGEGNGRTVEAEAESGLVTQEIDTGSEVRLQSLKTLPQ